MTKRRPAASVAPLGPPTSLWHNSSTSSDSAACAGGRPMPKRQPGPSGRRRPSGLGHGARIHPSGSAKVASTFLSPQSIRSFCQRQKLDRADVWSDRSPEPVVPDSPDASRRVPHQLSPRRPRRRRWLRRRPRRRGTPRSPTRRTALGRTLPVVAVIPVPLVDVAPARIPLITRAPVIARRWDRGRPDQGGGAAGQSEGGQGQPATQQRARRPPNPRSRSLYGRHLPRISLGRESKQVVIRVHRVRATRSRAQSGRRI